MSEFNIKKTIEYWKEGAKYNLETAETLLRGNRYPYALFFGHFALEKVLKALAVKETKTHASYTHSLPLLINKLSFEVPEEIKKN